ncbi:MULTISPECIES: ScbR family autoregulator-binding transcription factor [Streptomyces]|uniref:ScbR family autoregulator-binding transcription factor n=1 Tax=Streptomyces TaxID=1883 RepID=UPI001672FBEE|nr:MULTISPECIES: ScbR family autoregulator-binding transcription factor [Streptomyces]MBD3575364.1 TetR/AcrR family transcriptional regulator [Streptomyces sp. KD18]GGS92649.1 TetR family transcriptional regulator [Streptomyces toxytricini]
MTKQERAVRTRGTLIRSAAEVFGREGYSVASLAAISSLAGVSNGALHFHFASKAVLADAVEAAALARLADLVGGPLPPPGKGRVQHLVDTTHRLAGALRTDPVLRAGFQLAGESSRPPRHDLRGHWRAWVEEAVRGAETAGELRAGVAVRDAAAAVAAATTGLEVLGVRDAEWLSAAAVAGLWRLLLPALVPEAVVEGIEVAGGCPL